GRAGGVLPVRGPAVASAFVTSAFIAAAIVAPAREFALALVRVPAFVLVPAPKPLAGGTTLVVLARFANRRAVGRGRGGIERRIGAGLAEFILAIAPVPLVFYGFTSLACG